MVEQSLELGDMVDDKNLERIKNGKRELIIMCVISMLASIFIISLYNLNVGQDRLPGQIVRILLSILLMLCTVAGNRTAKWILLFTFVYSTFEFIKNFRTIYVENWFYYVYLLIAIYNFLFMIILLSSKNIDAYLEAIRVKNQSDNEKNPGA